MNNIGFPPKQGKGWITFEKNNSATAFISMFVPTNKESIRKVYISKHNLERERILLMITKKNKDWHYTAMTNESRLFKGIAAPYNTKEFHC